MSAATTLLPGLSTLQNLTIYHYFGTCLVLALICVFTRIVTGLRSNLHSYDVTTAKEVGVLPYYIPWIGSSISFGLRFQDFLADAQKETKDSVFALLLGGNRHNIVTSPSCTKQVFNQRTAVDNTELAYYVLRKFFGDQGSCRTVDSVAFFGDITKQLHGLMREPFLSDAITVTVRAIEERTPNLVGFVTSWVDESSWERSAALAVIGEGKRAVVEASFFPLVKNFVGEIACDALMGREFMENNPTILEDLWTWDAKFNLYLIGTPAWLPGMAQASLARERIRKAVQEHQEALFAVEDGREPGSKWSDLSDVSEVMVNRAREWRKANASPVARSAGDAVVLWAMNVNANVVIFWLLWHVYSNPTLLAEIRQEIDQYARVTLPTSDLPIPEADRLSLDVEGLRKSCPLLKATYFETLRVDVAATTYKSVVDGFTVTESPEDAAIAGKVKAQTYKLSKGQYICVPHGVYQGDERYFKDPATFNPKRFYVYDEESPEKVTVEMGTMNPFGGGSNMCKGRHFAEREVLAFSAAILVMWDIDPAEGTWAHPGSKPGSGTVSPIRDVRVRMKRRAK